MLVFNLSMDLDNDAFGEDSTSRRREIARILANVEVKLLNEPLFAAHPENLIDANGNTVGHCQIERAR